MWKGETQQLYIKRRQRNTANKRPGGGGRAEPWDSQSRQMRDEARLARPHFLSDRDGTQVFCVKYKDSSETRRLQTNGAPSLRCALPLPRLTARPWELCVCAGVNRRWAHLHTAASISRNNLQLAWKVAHRTCFLVLSFCIPDFCGTATQNCILAPSPTHTCRHFHSPS